MASVQNLGHDQELFAMYIHSHCEMALRYSVVKIQMYSNYQMGVKVDVLQNSPYCTINMS